jgi:hypothetical protein
VLQIIVYKKKFPKIFVEKKYTTLVRPPEQGFD